MKILRVAAGVVVLAVGVWMYRSSHGLSKSDGDSGSEADIFRGDQQGLSVASALDAIHDESQEKSMRCAMIIVRTPHAVAGWSSTDKGRVGRAALELVVARDLPRFDSGLWLEAIVAGGLVDGGTIDIVVGLLGGERAIGYREHLLRIAATAWRRFGDCRGHEVVMRELLQSYEDGLVDMRTAIPICVPAYGLSGSPQARVLIGRAMESADEVSHLQIAMEIVRWKCSIIGANDVADTLNGWMSNRYWVALAQAMVSPSDESAVVQWWRRQVLRSLDSQPISSVESISFIVNQYSAWLLGNGVDWERLDADVEGLLRQAGVTHGVILALHAAHVMLGGVTMNRRDQKGDLRDRVATELRVLTASMGLW